MKVKIGVIILVTNVSLVTYKRNSVSIKELGNLFLTTLSFQIFCYAVMRKQSFPRGIPKEDFGNENEAEFSRG
ncbi:MAG TPA: hypothetical protein VKA34_03535, partial [Balneolales bacterium]|nr:hypothetical protein [Balneolales bacterium]